MAGENLREEFMEVAFEQWTERASGIMTCRALVGSNAFPALDGSSIGDSRRM